MSQRVKVHVAVMVAGIVELDLQTNEAGELDSAAVYFPQAPKVEPSVAIMIDRDQPCPTDLYQEVATTAAMASVEWAAAGFRKKLEAGGSKVEDLNQIPAMKKGDLVQ